MTFVGTVFALTCTALGALQVWSASRRQAAELAHGVPGHGLLTYEFAGSPAKLRALMTAAGDRGREALRRGLEYDFLIVAGYVFVAVGLGGLLTAASRPGYGRLVIAFGLLAALFHLIEAAALRQAATTHPDGGGSAPIATVGAAMRFLLLAAAVAAFLLWPIRTWFG